MDTFAKIVTVIALAVSATACTTVPDTNPDQSFRQLSYEAKRMDKMDNPYSMRDKRGFR